LAATCFLRTIHRKPSVLLARLNHCTTYPCISIPYATLSSTSNKLCSGMPNAHHCCALHHCRMSCCVLHDWLIGRLEQATSVWLFGIGVACALDTGWCIAFDHNLWSAVVDVPRGCGILCVACSLCAIRTQSCILYGMYTDLSIVGTFYESVHHPHHSTTLHESRIGFQRSSSALRSDQLMSMLHHREPRLCMAHHRI
jgi:hypothetical protein